MPQKKAYQLAADECGRLFYNNLFEAHNGNAELTYQVLLVVRAHLNPLVGYLVAETLEAALNIAWRAVGCPPQIEARVPEPGTVTL